MAYSTLQHRRAAHPAFAQSWDAALVVGRAAAVKRGEADGRSARRRNDLRTAGGEEVVVRRKDGTWQVRRAQPGKLTKHCEQAFLAALSATCNVTLSAAAAGASPRAFYRRRETNPAFAREMRLALAQGYEAIEAALLESMSPSSGEDDAWRHNEPPAMPAMTTDQALHLMTLHQKEARLRWELPAFTSNYRRESPDERTRRIRDRYVEKLAEEAEHETLRRVMANRKTAGVRQPPIALPALDQVTGWSRADPAKGGERAADWKEKGLEVLAKRRKGR